MRKPKIIFFDIDGTLKSMQSPSISQTVLDTLRRLKAAGIKLCISTGRSPITVPPFPGVEFDAFITFNGSYCFAGDHTIYSNCLPKSDVATILSNAKAMGRYASAATKDRVVANGVERDLADYFSFATLALRVTPDFDKVVQGDVFQLMIACQEPEYDRLLRGTTGARITAWWEKAVDVIPKGGGKGAAVHKVLDYFGLTPEDAMAFGDGNNDLEMLQTVGFGVAMGNASQALKACAQAVCGSVEEEGVYHFCLDEGLI